MYLTRIAGIETFCIVVYLCAGLAMYLTRIAGIETTLFSIPTFFIA